MPKPCAICNEQNGKVEHINITICARCLWKHPLLKFLIYRLFKQARRRQLKQPKQQKRLRKWMNHNK